MPWRHQPSPTCCCILSHVLFLLHRHSLFSHACCIMCQACPVPQACRRTPTKGTKRAGAAATRARWEAHGGPAPASSLSLECRSRPREPQVWLSSKFTMYNPTYLSVLCMKDVCNSFCNVLISLALSCEIHVKDYKKKKNILLYMLVSHNSVLTV